MFMTIKEQLKCSAYFLHAHFQLFVLHCTTTGRKLSLSRGCVDVFSNFTKNVEGLTGWTCGGSYRVDMWRVLQGGQALLLKILRILKKLSNASLGFKFHL